MESPPVIVSRPPRYLWWLGGGFLMVAAGIVLFLFNPSLNGFYPRCQFYAITGLYCPGCGAQRALHSLVHLHVLTALRDNSLVILSLPVFAYLGFRKLGREYDTFALPPIPTPRGWVTLVIITVVLFTILRNIPYLPFDHLAPQ
jgi:hypothetical protein